jgi:hypothetical protein
MHATANGPTAAGLLSPPPAPLWLGPKDDSLRIFLGEDDTGFLVCGRHVSSSVVFLRLFKFALEDATGLFLVCGRHDSSSSEAFLRLFAFARVVRAALCDDGSSIARCGAGAAASSSSTFIGLLTVLLVEGW